MYFFSLLTKITSFRHIPSTEKCVETDYNIYYSDSKDRDRLESYFRSNSILRLAVLFPKPQYKNGSHLEIQSARFTELLSWECSLRLRFDKRLRSPTRTRHQRHIIWIQLVFQLSHLLVVIGRRGLNIGIGQMMFWVMYIMIYGTPKQQMEEVFHTMKTIT